MNTLLTRMLMIWAFITPLKLFSQPLHKLVNNMDYTHMDVERIGKQLNTDEPDLAPFRYGDKLYFTSSKIEGQNGEKVNRIYTAIQGSPAVLFNENPNDEKINMSETALTVRGDRMYFTINRQAGETSNNKCKIWYRDRDYDGRWGAMEYIPSPINDSRYTNCMPSAGIMRFTREEVLFFVSDRPGGKGKLDIWCTVVNKDGSFGEPVNLPFNTPEDDVTPCFNTANQTLFFSSNRPNGIGGLDVYHVVKTKTGWGKAEMLKAPINSEFDDYYFFYHNGSNTAYFSSNRPKGFSANTSYLNDNVDIYSVNFSPQKTTEEVDYGNVDHPSNQTLKDVGSGNISLTASIAFDR